MTKEEIIAGNKLISEFMCFKISKDEISSHTAIKENNKVIGFKSMDFYGKINNGGRQGSWNSFDEMEFYTSWDWLMPVIQKCLKINEENLDDWEKYYEAIDDSFYQINIEQTFKEVLNFIIWYNNQKRK